MGKQSKMRQEEALSKLPQTSKVATQSKKTQVKSSRHPVATASVEEQYTSDDEEDDPEVKRAPFRFLDLPSELRLRVYEEVLHLRDPIDLDPNNYRLIRPRLGLFLANRQLHEEAYRIFYSQPLRLFPTHGRFFHTKKPLLMRLSPRYRNAINALEVRLGPGWSAPPRGQKITPELGLLDCRNVRRLRVFVECDPSESFFAGFRGKGATEDTYKDFCIDLLSGIFEQCPSIAIVQIDAFPAVKWDAPLIMALRALVNAHQKTLQWGPLRGWAPSTNEPGMLGLEALMASMAISTPSALVPVEA